MDAELSQIANITTGVYEKGRLSGDTLYLQAKHFDEQGKFLSENILHPEIQMDDRLKKHILQDKDLLITAKGQSNRVCLYKSKIGQSVASSTFFVIRLQESFLLPEYLQWYMNTSKMQSAFSNLSKGTHILSLSKKALSKVRIEIPPLDKQQKVLKLHSLWEKERKTTMELMKNKEIYYQQLLINYSKV